MSGVTIAQNPPWVTGTTRVRTHALRMRPDGESWVIGRVETGEFISVPPVGQRAVTLLAENRTVDEVSLQLRKETGTDVDVAGFVAALSDLGFLTAIDGRDVDQPPPARPSLPWLKPPHVRWLLHPAAPIAAATLIAAAIAVVLANHSLVPRYHDLLWSRHGSVVIVGNAAIAWTLIFLHELAHLATARAVDVPARMTLSTRLQFLAAQTDVSGVWAQPRRIRLTVYLAGITVNLVIAAVGVLILATTPLPNLAQRLIAATILLALLLVTTQLLIFMRTDVYFVVQDLTGCANLYADGSAYLLHHAKHLWNAVRRHHDAPTHPLHKRATPERHAIRAYSIILVSGTALCLTGAATITLPAAFTLLARAAHGLIDPTSVGSLLDSGTVFLVTGGFQILWARTWWRRHGHRLTRHLARTRHQAAEGR